MEAKVAGIIMEIIEEVNSKCSEYILKNYDFQREVEWYNRYAEKGDKQAMSYKLNDIRKLAYEYDERYLCPANVKVGDGATIKLYTDRYAGTIIKVTPTTITVQRDKATLDPNFKPEWILGGFSAICLNQEDQKYTYERDEQGEIYTFRWSEKYQSYGRPNNLRASRGRHEFYDYNF